MRRRLILGILLCLVVLVAGACSPLPTPTPTPTVLPSRLTATPTVDTPIDWTHLGYGVAYWHDTKHMVSCWTLVGYGSISCLSDSQVYSP